MSRTVKQYDLIEFKVVFSIELYTNISDGYAVFGKFNADEDKIFIVGNGTSDNDRKNAMTIDHNNNMTVGGTVNITDSTDGTVIDLLAKIKELEQRISALES